MGNGFWGVLIGAAVVLTPTVPVVVGAIVMLRKSRADMAAAAAATKAAAEKATAEAAVAAEIAAVSVEQKRDEGALGPLRITVNDLRKEIREVKADNARREEAWKADALRQQEAWKAHAIEQQAALDRCVNDHRRSREREIRQYGNLVRIHDYACRTGAACKRLGEDPGDAPVLPPEPDDSSDVEDAAFEQRQLQQATELLSALPPPAP